MWFRSDLRLADNSALAQACRDADDGLVAVFLIASKQWREHDWGDAKVDFVLRNVKALSEALAERNIALLVREADSFSDAPKVLLKVARDHACDELFFNGEYEVNERRRDEVVIEAFESEGLSVRSFHDQTIVPPAALETNAGDFYSVFTPFKKSWIAHLEEHGVPKVEQRPRKRSERIGRPDTVQAEVRHFDRSRGHPTLWPAGEVEAKKRLRRFIDSRIGDYKKLRDYPAEDATSTLSPYLTVGVISPRQCLHAALSANDDRLDGGDEGAAIWISELIWREFYRHVLVGWPRVCMNRAFRPETDAIGWSGDDARFEAWCEGRTGVPIVDAAMRQLLKTGWMHNRLRMIVAMFLTKDLFIDWRWGERHFMRHLVDGDFASNNGGWQWAASTGTDAAPYFRIFNPVTQSRKFDPSGAFIRRYVPELRDLDDVQIHEPYSKRDPLDDDLNYPEPIVDHKAAREHAIKAFRSIR
jgi:deoxyribodipyrimidine photo-lyase